MGKAPLRSLASCIIACACVSAPVYADKFQDEGIISVIRHLQAGGARSGVKNISNVSAKQPDNRIGQLIHNDLLRAKLGAYPVLAVSAETAAAAPDEKMSSMVAETRTRLFNHFNPPPSDAVPQSLLRLGEDQPYAIVVDQDVSRTYVFKNVDGTAQRVTDYYSTIGRKGAGKEVEGDLRTPIGVYFVTSKKTDAELPELYGISAFPVSYPNMWDRRVGRTGGGIWLHGVPRSRYTRAPLASRGCVVLANDKMVDIEQYIRVGRTPVILSKGIDWQTPETIATRRNELQARFNAWAEAWASLDTKKYLSFYSANFYGSGMNKSRWSKYKYDVNSRKKYIKVGTEEVSILHDPRDAMVVTSFKLNYESDNFKSQGRKRLFWRLESDGEWRIVSEHNP